MIWIRFSIFGIRFKKPHIEIKKSEQVQTEPNLGPIPSVLLYLIAAASSALPCRPARHWQTFLSGNILPFSTLLFLEGLWFHLSAVDSTSHCDSTIAFPLDIYLPLIGSPCANSAEGICDPMLHDGNAATRTRLGRPDGGTQHERISVQLLEWD